MPEIIAFRDPEKWVVRYLKSRPERQGRRAGTRAPRGAKRYTRISRAGGASRDMVTDSPRILVECFAEDAVAAEADMRIDRALLLSAARTTDEVTRVVDAAGPSFLPDPDTNLPRYQFSVQLDMRGEAL